MALNWEKVETLTCYIYVQISRLGSQNQNQLTMHPTKNLIQVGIISPVTMRQKF